MALAASHDLIRRLDERFETETEGEWRSKLAGGTRGTVDVLVRELRCALAS